MTLYEDTLDRVRALRDNPCLPIDDRCALSNLIICLLEAETGKTA